MADIAERKQLRILLVDDDDAVRAVLGSMLRRLKYRVDYACDGCEVVNLTARESYDLILMDIQMRYMDGLTASLFIRLIEQKQGRRTPIVAVTAHTSKEYMEKCLAAGIDAYLAKPLVFKDVANLMEEMLRRKGRQNQARVVSFQVLPSSVPNASSVRGEFSVVS